MTNHQIAAIFDQIADLLEFQDANAFRVRAYRNAARTIHDLPESVADIIANPQRSLTSVEGIGKDLAGKIVTLIETGTLPMLEELLAKVPESVLAILRVPGLGPKRASQLFRELNVATLDQLREACELHKVQHLKGFGTKTEAAIVQGLGIASEADKRVLWIDADQHVQEILSHMRECKAVERIAAAGSYRRGKETVGDLDFLVVTANVPAVMNHLASFGAVASIIARGDTKMSLRLSAGLQVDLRAVEAEAFGAALQYFTGSKEHNIVLRGRAKAQGLKINEYGVFRGDARIAGRTEEEVYETLGLPWFPPELREARREFEWADAGHLPKLVELQDIRGDLHSHTNWTDGTTRIGEMVYTARARGLKYLAITDHSKRVSMAHGLDAGKLREQWAEIDKLNRRLDDFTALKGVEVDILEHGGLDLPNDVLGHADWVVASVHYGQQQSREQITQRVIEAIANPRVSAIGHPTGRMLLQRKAYDIDLDAVMRACREHGKMLELNAHPTRLDIDDVACAAAKAMGVPVVISTDSHRPEGFDFMRCGVQQARRGGLTKADVANTREWPELKKLLTRPS
ncbi:MAG: DNA polymerase/3'-5' exonuclease PolX [Planctomycetaceae bacterium]|nr:DNA polymerase/3'-5' exonuclease PolX [Planctomycetaceae bacterium]